MENQTPAESNISSSSNQSEIDMRYARANGGHLFHKLPEGTTKALCGFKPSSPKGHVIRGRGHWATIRDTVPALSYRCDKCFK